MNEYGKYLNNELKSRFPNTDYSGKVAIDLGCGNGADSLFLASKNIKVFVVDTDLDVLKKFSHKNIQKVQKDLRNFEFKKNAYDIVIAFNVLHYLTINEIKKVFPKILNSVKKDGLLLIQMFNSPVVDFINKKLEDWRFLYYRQYLYYDKKPFPHTHYVVDWTIRKGSSLK